MGKNSTPRMLKENAALAVHPMLRVSPQKLNLVAGLIRGKTIEKALANLMNCSRRISDEVKKVVGAAVSNAENNHNLDIDRLYVAEASVGKAVVMKRFRPRARGRSGKILKPFSRLRIIVQELEETK